MKDGIGTKARYIFSGDKVICIITPINQFNHLRKQIAYMRVACHDVGFSTYWEPIPNEFKGIATYKEGDTKDYEFAKEIARKKAVRQMYKYYYNAYKVFCTKFGKVWAEYINTVGKVEERIDSINKEIEEMIKE